MCFPAEAECCAWHTWLCWATPLRVKLWKCSVALCILGRGSSPRGQTLPFISSEWEVNVSAGCSSLPITSQDPESSLLHWAANSYLWACQHQLSALLPVFVVSAHEPMGELIPNTALPWAKQHDAKLSICKYTFNYKPLGVRSIPWGTGGSVKSGK